MSTNENDAAIRALAKALAQLDEALNMPAMVRKAAVQAIMLDLAEEVGGFTVRVPKPERTS